MWLFINDKLEFTSNIALNTIKMSTKSNHWTGSVIMTHFFVLKTITINNLTVTNEKSFNYFLSVHFDKKFQLFCKSFDLTRENLFISVNKTTQQTRRTISKIIIIQTNPNNYVQSPGELVILVIVYQYLPS